MGKLIAKLLAKTGRWKVDPFPDVKKAVVLMAPHTSAWDFYYGRLFFMFHGKKPSILIKKESFKWPVGPVLKKLGGVPVDRGARTAVPTQVLRNFRDKEEFYLIITPESTRAKTKNWKKGFIRIAKPVDVPVILGYLDCKDRKWGIFGLFDMSGSDDEIMERLKKKYTGLTGVHPDKFETGYENEINPKHDNLIDN
jgi:1-acyl-sn-glycerol-3-phosphate acyltransferase